MALAAGTVAEELRAEATRMQTLDALEAHPPPVPRDVALAAAPALVDVVARSTAEKERAAFDRSALLLGRLMEEALPDSSAVYGAAFVGDRLAAYLGSPLLAEAMQRALVEEGGRPLTDADARSFACLKAYESPAAARGWTVVEAAAGRTGMEFLGVVRALAPTSCPTHFVNCWFCVTLTRPALICGLRGAVYEQRPIGTQARAV